MDRNIDNELKPNFENFHYLSIVSSPHARPAGTSSERSDFSGIASSWVFWAGERRATSFLIQRISLELQSGNARAISAKICCRLVNLFSALHT